MSSRKQITTGEFILKARIVHGDRYDYSKTEYVRTHAKVKVLCREHGIFEQTPANHLTGFGCKLCGFKNAGQYHKKNTNTFIQEARKAQGISMITPRRRTRGLGKS